MKKNDDILNAGYALFVFYLLKFGFLFGALVQTGIAYIHYNSNNPLWILFVFGIVIFLLISDAAVLPIEFSKDGIRCHHQWRISTLLDSKVRIIYKGALFDKRIKIEEGEELIIATNGGRWPLYIFQCDPKNNLSEHYDSILKKSTTYKRH